MRFRELRALWNIDEDEYIHEVRVLHIGTGNLLIPAR